MKNNQNLYSKDSIQSLNPLEFVRLRPSVYCGSTEYSTQLLTELFANSTDEFQIGNAHTIIINSLPNYTYELSDDGQGILPNVLREDGKTIFEAVLGQLNTSGKYNSDGVYEGSSIGVNGIGLKLVTFLSHWVEGLTWRDGKYERIWFKEGEFEKREIGEWTEKNNPHGTKIIWQPNEKFFVHPEVEDNKVKELIQSTVCLCQGLTVKFNNETYFSSNGIDDLIDGKDEILKNRLRIKYQNGKHKLDLSLTYTNSYSSSIISYVNTGFTTSGPHITQIKTILTREMNKFFREKKWLKDKDENLSGDDCQEGLKLVFHLITTDIGYDGQLKDRIVKINMTPFTSVISEELQNWLNNNEKAVKVIADKAINARKAREAAKKAREAVRQPKEKGLKAKLALSTKFTDCISKNPKERNLLLVEGQSAASSAIEARNTRTDCIYQLRGKIISPLKTDVSKILQNQEMSDIIRVIGAGFGNDFDVSKMNFNKVVITSDQDSDGFDIELLLLTFFYTYMRPLVEAGKLYRAVTPLYIIRQKDKEYYCYSDAELEEWKNSHSGKYDLLRAKGLGELNAEDLQRVCFMNERYKRITISDIEKTTELLNILQGPSVEPRKKYIYENAKDLGFEFD